MSDLGRYPNVKKAIIGLLGDLADTRTRAPDGDGWNGDPACLRVRVLGGSDVGTVTDVTFVDIDALTGSETASDGLAEDVRQRILSAPGRKVGDFVFDTTTNPSRPHSVPWGHNAAIFNTTATYRVSCRRATAT